MAFDITTAKPVKKGFDLSTARPKQETADEKRPESKKESGWQQFSAGLGTSLLEQTPDVQTYAQTASMVNPLLKPMEIGLSKSGLSDMREDTLQELRDYERPMTGGGKIARMTGRVAGYVPAIIGGAKAVGAGVKVGKEALKQASGRNTKAIYDSAKKIVSELKTSQSAYGEPVKQTVSQYKNVKTRPVSPNAFDDLTPSIKKKLESNFNVKFDKNGVPLNDVENYWNLKRGLDQPSAFGTDSSPVKDIARSLRSKVRSSVVEVVPELIPDMDAYGNFMDIYDEILPKITKESGTVINERPLVNLFKSGGGSSEFKMAVEGIKDIAPGTADPLFNLEKLALRETASGSGIGKADIVKRAFGLRGMTPYKKIAEDVVSPMAETSKALVPIKYPNIPTGQQQGLPYQSPLQITRPPETQLLTSRGLVAGDGFTMSSRPEDFIFRPKPNKSNIIPPEAGDEFLRRLWERPIGR